MFWLDLKECFDDTLRNARKYEQLGFSEMN